MQPALIRTMTLADLDLVVAIAESERNAPQWPRSAYAAAVDPAAQPMRIALVAEDVATRQVAGFVVARVISPEAELETIVTATAFQRRGLAREMFVALAVQLERAGAVEVSLELRESNHRAKALYVALGFEETGRRTAYYADPVEDAVLMIAKLQAAS